MGVILGVMNATYPGPHNQTPDTLAKLPPSERQAYIDTRRLIDKVLASGDVPSGSYEELLDLPHGESAVPRSLSMPARLPRFGDLPVPDVIVIQRDGPGVLAIRELTTRFVSEHEMSDAQLAVLQTLGRYVPDKEGRVHFRRGFGLGYSLGQALAELHWQPIGFVDARTWAALATFWALFGEPDTPVAHSQLLAFAMTCGLYYSVQDTAEEQQTIKVLEDLLSDVFSAPG